MSSVPALKRLLQKSDLVITQEYIPAAFDWRVGVLDRRALFVCKYFKAPDHWQVIKRDANGRVEGQAETRTRCWARRSIVK